MATKKSRKLTEQTRRIVWAQSAGRCQFRNCNEPLIGHLIAANRGANKGYVAHIIADSSKGPRGDDDLSEKLENDPDNVMLLCDPCHREIDKENPEKYLADDLRAMKREHDDWVQTVLSGGPNSRSHVLQFSARIGTNRTAIPIDECTRAMMPVKTPATATPIEIKVRGAHVADSDPNYWELEVGNLRHQMEALQIRHRMEAGEISHLSVFGLAPIPLLIEFGSLLSDISAVSVFQLHREPQGQGWKWAEDTSKMGLTLNDGSAECKHVALKLAISANIEDSRVTNVLGDDVSIWEITCRAPHNDVMRRSDDLSTYRSLIRRAFERIKDAYGRDVVVSVFPAIGVACAVELGRVWQPKAHPAFEIYDQSGSSGFKLRHRVG